MGTSYTVKLVGSASRTDAGRAALLQAEIDERLAGVCRLMSPFLADSELSRFNRHGGDSPFRVSDETFHVFQRAIQIGDESQGAFDITVGPIANLYGFGADPFRVNLPSDAELEPLRARVGYRMLELDPAAKTVRKKHPEIRCDLSGIAKGYGVDRIAAELDAHEIGDYMVEIGGEVRVRGRNPEGGPWRIAVERPVPEGRVVHRVVGLLNRSVATSGDYRVCYVRDGKRISHTIDPRTGRPVEHDLASVTVIHGDCESADAWATALMVLGPEAGCEFAERKGLPALFLVRQGDESIVEKATSSFPAPT
jgi:thiamine biosynthesis lipoprotein